MRIDGLKKYQRRDRRDYFSDLPAPIRAKANEWLRRFCNRRGGNPPRWLFAIYVAQAKRLALNPPDAAWGRSMLARRGGRAVQRRYRLEGRHPTEKATQRRLALQKARKAERARLQASRPSSPQSIQPPRRTIEWDPPGPSLAARQLRKRLDPPGCRCYWCTWPHHES